MSNDCCEIADMQYDEINEKYQKLLEFVKSVKNQSCCNVCDCRSCDALKLLRDIGEDK